MVGLNGNAFSIIGAFSKAARAQHWSGNEIKAVTDEAMSGDYSHLLATILANVVSPDEAEQARDDESLTSVVDEDGAE